MSKNLTCLRCEQKMDHVGTEKLQLGKTGWIFGDWSNLLAGAMGVDIYCCPKCKKVEFFLADDDFLEKHSEDESPQKQCPQCGKWHDFDYPKCPFCKYDYYEE